MAERPWIIPSDVKSYTEYPSVIQRDDSKLDIDIARAEAYIINYTNNDFSSVEDVPEEIKTAAILITEVFACKAANAARSGFKSETFDDYSYTLADNFSIELSDLSLGVLLDEFKQVKSKGGVTMNLRKF